MPPTYPMPPFYPRPGALPCCPGPSSRPEPFQPNPLGDPHLAERLKRVLDTLTADMAWVRANKVDKASGGVPGNIAGIDANGNLYDTGKRAADVYDKPDGGIPYADLSEEVQGWLDAASTAVRASGVKTDGNFTSWDASGKLADSGKKPADFATAAQGAKADTAVQPSAISGFVDGAEYDAEYGDPAKPTILLKHGDAVVASVDASAFVIDGMVSTVAVTGGNLVITFNTDSGKQPISIPLTDIFNPANYYTKTETNALAALAERGFSAWTITAVPEGLDPADVSVEWGDPGSTYGYEAWYFNVPGGWSWTGITDQSITSLVYDDFAATRTALQGYQLGSQSTKPLASEAEAEALRNAVAAKYAKPSGGIPKSDLASAVQASLGKADTALQTHQQLADVYGGNGEKYSAWTLEPSTFQGLPLVLSPASGGGTGWEVYTYNSAIYGPEAYSLISIAKGDDSSTSLTWTEEVDAALTVTATRTANPIISYQLGSQSDRKLATAAQGARAMTAVQPADMNAALNGKANRAANPTAGNLAALDAQGNPTDSGKKSTDFMAADAKTKRVWADGEKTTADANGTLRGVSLAESYFTLVKGTSRYTCPYLGTVGTEGDPGFAFKYDCVLSSYFLYYPSSGVIWYSYNSQSWGNHGKDKDPRLESCTFDVFDVPNNSMFGSGYTAYFHPKTATETSTVGHLALESIPDREYSNTSIYAVGDLVKYGNPAKAYRCNTAISTPENWTAAHWTEIPILAQKQDALTFDSTPTVGSTNPVTSGGVKTAIDNIKVQKIYNAGGDEATDDKGQMFRSAIETGGHWEVDVTPNGGVTTHAVYMLSFNETNYAGWRGSSYKIDYNKRSGALVWWERVTLSPSISNGLNPTNSSQSQQMAGTYTGSGSGYTITATYVAQGPQLQTTPSDFLARVSDLTAFNSTKSYSVGDIVGYQGMVYKCTTAHSEGWNASHFTLATKAEVQVYLAGIVASISGKLDLSGGTMQGAIQWRFGDSINGHAGVLVITDSHNRVWRFSRGSSEETGSGYVAWTHEIPYSLVQREIQPGEQLWRVTSTPTGVDPADVTTGFDDGSGWYFYNMATEEYFYTYNLDTEATSFSHDDYTAELVNDPDYVNLADHAVNAVTVGSAVQALRLRFPNGTGKARDFALRLTLSAGVTTAPELVPDDLFTVETADGEMPAVEAATAGAAATTIIYFTETAAGKFFAAAAPAKVVS